MVGSWKIHNRFLKGRLCGSTEWLEFEATYDFRLLLDGSGNIDRFSAVRDGKQVEGLTLRLFDPARETWSLYWADNVRPGVLQPPMVGRWEGDHAEFFGEEEVDGRKVACVFRWTRGEHPRWEQAFSNDEGRTWETNWIMEFTRENSK